MAGVPLTDARVTTTPLRLFFRLAVARFQSAAMAGTKVFYYTDTTLWLSTRSSNSLSGENESSRISGSIKRPYFSLENNDDIFSPSNPLKSLCKSK